MSKKQIQTNSRKVPRKKRRRISPFLVILCFILSIASLALVGYLVFQLFQLDMFPLTLLIPVVSVVILLTLMIILFANFKCRRKVSKVFMTLLLAALTTGYGFGNYYVYGLTNLFNEVTNLTDKTAVNINVLTTVDSGKEELSSLNDCVLGVVETLDSEGTTRCIQEIDEKIDFETVEYYSVNALVEGLFNGEVDGIIMNESYEGLIHEDYIDFGVRVNRVYKTTYYKDRSESQAGSINEVSNITTDPFTVLISGNDSYGSLNENSRSDANMLLTINPKTNTVLMTSIPRDLYVPIACSVGAENCPDGERDKLTHTGLYGIETTDQTIEEFLDIEVNYIVRVNFSSVVNIVDSVDGIDVYVEEGLDVDTFYANGTEGVKEGWNHLDGERALAFSRERYAYVDGDTQRVKNQQIVLQALIKKIASPSMLVNFDDFVNAVGIAFETNMPADQIKSFIRYQFAMMPDWKFESFTLSGENSNQFCPTLGMNADVLLPYKEYLDTATEKIQAVLDGESSESIEEPSTDPSQLTLWDFSEYSDTGDVYGGDASIYGQDPYALYGDTTYGY